MAECSIQCVRVCTCARIYRYTPCRWRRAPPPTRRWAYLCDGRAAHARRSARRRPRHTHTPGPRSGRRRRDQCDQSPHQYRIFSATLRRASTHHFFLFFVFFLFFFLFSFFPLSFLVFCPRTQIQYYGSPSHTHHAIIPNSPHTRAPHTHTSLIHTHTQYTYRRRRKHARNILYVQTTIRVARRDTPNRCVIFTRNRSRYIVQTDNNNIIISSRIIRRCA